MDKPVSKPPSTQLNENGIYLRGVVISNSARKITKKDGNILVIVRHELALQPGVVLLEEFLDPKFEPDIRIEGDEVTKFPLLKEFESISVRGSRIRENNGQISVGNWEII